MNFLKLKKGFTLAEMLVVVLILGILAGIALPQYKIAVEKSRAQQAIITIESVANAQELYYFYNGKYTTEFSDLDIEVEENIQGWTFELYNTSAMKKVQAKHSSLQNDLLIVHYYKHPGTTSVYPGRTYCYAKAGNKFADKLCRSLAAKEGYANSSGTRYII